MKPKIHNHHQPPCCGCSSSDSVSVSGIRVRPVVDAMAVRVHIGREVFVCVFARIAVSSEHTNGGNDY